MAKTRRYIEETTRKRWMQWCDTCAHAFKTDAGEPLAMVIDGNKPSLLQRLRLKKVVEGVQTEYKKPNPSKCPVCGKNDNVTVIKIQEDVVESITGSS